MTNQGFNGCTTIEILKGFSAFENEFIHNNILSDGAYRLATVMATYRFQNDKGAFNDVTASQITFSKILNRSVRTIQRYLTELKDAGYIKIVRRGYKTNKYEFLREIKRYIDSTIKGKKENTKAHVEYLRRNYGDKKLNKKSLANKGNFNNFKQREYDFDDLERKLLGWDKKE